MITKDNLKALLTSLNFTTKGEVYSKHFDAFDCSLQVDFKAEKLIYPIEKGFVVNENQTCNFSSPENFVVFECVHRLLSQGYHPQHIELEPRWKLGHSAKSGRADILVKNQQNDPLLIIECKTAGDEFRKAWKDTLEDGAQLFSYIEQEKAVEFVCLYASDIENNDIKTFQRIISHKDNAKILSESPDLKSFNAAKNVKERFNVWKYTYKQEYTEKGIFEDNIQPYHIGKDKYTLALDTKMVDASDKKGKYHEFRTILRKYNVSRRENAFEVLVNLFLCKIVDETENPNDLKFYWKGIAYDNYYDLVDRLQALYKQGMEKFLKQDIVYISNQDIDAAFWAMKQKRNATKDTIKDIFRQLKFFKGLDFEFIKVHNKEQFDKNAKILLEIIQMWQGLRLLSTGQNQFLGDMFEFFLDNGIKQSEGQFFTPVPICKFIVASLPLEQAIINSNEPLKTIDYACGAGHFLNEYALSITPLVAQHKQANIKDYYNAIVGIEKEDRLAKVAKVSAFMYGQDDIQIIDADALDNHEQIKPHSFNCLVANPPFAVEDFLLTLPEAVRESYQLFETVNDTGNKNIQCFFLERAKQLLAPNGVTGIIVPSSILNNSDNTHVKTREILLQHFDFIAIVELGSGTFGKTGTNTVVLFMRRKAHNPSQAQHFSNRVDDFFDDWQNELATAGGAYNDIRVVQAYCQHQGFDFDAYQALLQNSYHERLFSHELFAEYQKSFDNSTVINNLKKTKQFKDKSEAEQQQELQKRLLAFVLGIEKEKLFYFMLAQANPTTVLVVKSPSDNKEQKAFLGYEWSGAKGSEGIKYNAGESANDIITPLYNPNNRNDNSKINALICDNFNSINNPIPEALAPYVSRVKLADMLDFSRVEFNKAISLNTSKKVEIESKWDVVKLSAYITIIGGGTPKTDVAQYWDGDTPWLSVGDFNDDNRFVYQAEKSITKLGLENSSTKVLEVGDLIISARGTVGALAQIGVPMAFNQSCYGLKVKEGLDSGYLYYILSKEVQQLKNNAYGSKFDAITTKTFESIKIPLPPLPIQQQIVDECQAVDNEVNAAKATISTAKADIEQIMVNVQGDKVKLGDVCELKAGKFVSASDINDVNDGNLYPCYGGNGLRGYTKTFTHEGSYPLIGRQGALCGNVNFATGKFHATEHAVVVTPKQPMNIHWLYHHLITLNLNQYKTGVAQPGLSVQNLNSVAMLLPSVEEQQAIASKIEALEAKIKQAQTIIDNSKARKEAVLKAYL
ncbi:MAG: hypothetical protein B7X52_03140 [Thiotrichales bacterium 34-46-19]|nr:MAG: hypothetical protein B7X52_03140 [Thiotrichales bacterium 34-46-19]